MKQWVEENNIVVLKADKSNDSPEVDQLLVELGNPTKALPYYALMRPEAEPVHFNGVYLNPGSFIDRISVGGLKTPPKRAGSTKTRNVVEEIAPTQITQEFQLPPPPSN